MSILKFQLHLCILGMNVYIACAYYDSNNFIRENDEKTIKIFMALSNFYNILATGNYIDNIIDLRHYRPRFANHFVTSILNQLDCYDGMAHS